MVEDTDEQLIFQKIGCQNRSQNLLRVHFCYKTHLAMSEERIITAAVVTSGEKGDGHRIAKITANKPGQRDGSRCHYWRCDLQRKGENLKIARAKY